MHPSLRKTPQHLPPLRWGEVSDQMGGARAAEVTLSQSWRPASAHFYFSGRGPHHFCQARQKERQDWLAEGTASSFLLHSTFFRESSSTR